MRIFVSYTTRDKNVSVDLLRRVRAGLSCFSEPFVDILDNDSCDRQERVARELQRAEMVLHLRSPVHSEWVTWELNRAKQLSLEVVARDVHSASSSRLYELLEPVTRFINKPADPQMQLTGTALRSYTPQVMRMRERKRKGRNHASRILHEELGVDSGAAI